MAEASKGPAVPGQDPVCLEVCVHGSALLLQPLLAHVTGHLGGGLRWRLPEGGSLGGCMLWTAREEARGAEGGVRLPGSLPIGCSDPEGALRCRPAFVSLHCQPTVDSLSPRRGALGDRQVSLPLEVGGGREREGEPPCGHLAGVTLVGLHFPGDKDPRISCGWDESGREDVIQGAKKVTCGVSWDDHRGPRKV